MFLYIKFIKNLFKDPTRQVPPGNDRAATVEVAYVKITMNFELYEKTNKIYITTNTV